MEKERILAMHRDQYEAQVASAKRELRRSRDEVKRLAQDLRQAVAEYKKKR
jgi:multidrug resistance efflux pump